MQFFLALLLFFPFVVYRLTSSPTIGWVDSGVIATAAATLGIANPPGFPLYMLIGHIFTKLPIGSVVLRLQLLSHLSSIGILVLVFFFVRNLPVGKYRNVLAVFASLALAFSYNFWSQATNIETYSFTNFVLFLFLFGALLADTFFAHPSNRLESSKVRTSGEKLRMTVLEKDQLAAPLVFFFLLGLAMGANPIIAGVLPVVGWLLWVKKKLVMANAKIFFVAGGCFLLGTFLIYSYLPIRASAHPFLDWGDPVTIERIKTHLVGGGLNIYEPATNSINGFTGQPSIWLKSFFSFWHLAIFQFTPILFPLVVLGWWKLKYINRTLFWMLTLVLGANLAFIILYYGGNQESWMITSFIVMAIFLGVGTGEVFGWMEKQKKEFARPIRVAFLAISLLPLLFWYPLLNRSKHTFADDYMVNLYRNVPEGSVVIGAGDFFHAVGAYNHEVTAYRRDIIPITGNMFYIFPWYRKNLALHTRLLVSNDAEKIVQFKSVDEFTNLIDQLIVDNPKRQFFVTPLLLRETIVAGHKDGNYHTKRYTLLPYGLLYKVVPLDSKETPDEKLYEFTFRYPDLVKGPSPFYFERNYAGAYKLLRNDYAVADMNLADYYMEKKNTEKASLWYQKAVEQGTADSGEFLQRLAIFYAQTKQLDKAKIYFEKSLTREPTNRDMLANYQTFLSQEKAATPSASLPASYKTYQNSGISLTYLSDWKVTKNVESVVVTDPSNTFRITIKKLVKEKETPVEAFVANQKQTYGTLVNQGLAKIPNMDDAYLKIWSKDGMSLYEFFLFQKDKVFEVVVSPADSALMREFDQMVSTLKAL